MSDQEQDSKGKGVDLFALTKILWQRKKTIGIWCAIGAAVGLIIAFSIPKEYTTEITLAPEANDAKVSSGGLSALAAMAGVGNSAAGSDAVYPYLYPDIIQSVPFIISLLDVPVTDKTGEKHLTVKEYMLEETKAPWWNFFTSLPGQIIGALSSSDDDISGSSTGNKGLNPFRLSKKQFKLVRSVGSRVTAKVDKKTDVVTLSVTMQDPLVSALLADTVASRLREYVTEYRTNKARQDALYLEQINQEAKEKYYQAQQRYADYLDTHQGIALYSVRTMRDRLENEATLAFNIYNQTSQQLQVAKAKVQEVTPVYTTLKPATVPVVASAPRKVLILVGCVFLAFVACCSYILFVEPLRAQPGSQPE